jgi:hypothetical protein
MISPTERDFQIIFQIATFRSLVASAGTQRLAMDGLVRYPAPKIGWPSWALRAFASYMGFEGPIPIAKHDG